MNIKSEEEEEGIYLIQKVQSRSLDDPLPLQRLTVSSSKKVVILTEILQNAIELVLAHDYMTGVQELITREREREGEHVSFETEVYDVESHHSIIFVQEGVLGDSLGSGVRRPWEEPLNLHDFGCEL